MLIWTNRSPETSIKEKKAKYETVYSEPVCIDKCCVFKSVKICIIPGTSWEGKTLISQHCQYFASDTRCV